MKILNLYAGIGGNRKLWGNEHKVTAIEVKPKIAKVYQKHFPNDKVIVTDAHKYILKNYDKFDFIWSSPPCPTHSRIRFMATKSETNLETNRHQLSKMYPDMRLYQQIIFLQNYCETKWVVENVISYYEPLIKPQEVGKHYFWSNFRILPFRLNSRQHHSNIATFQKKTGFNLDGVDLGHRKDQILRNCVEPELGLHILNCAFKIQQKSVGDFTLTPSPLRSSGNLINVTQLHSEPPLCRGSPFRPKTPTESFG